MPKIKNNSGIIIYVVLWVLVVLTALAISLGRNTQIELALAKHSVGALRAEQLAWAGLVYALDLVKQDSSDENYVNKDTLYACGIAVGAQDTLENIFKDKSLKDGHFTIAYRPANDTFRQKSVYGFEDQERFININTLTPETKNVLVQLLVQNNVEASAAEGIANAVIDWKDTDSVPLEPLSPTEDEYYTGLSTPYHAKNAAFDSREELLLVKGVTKEIFDNIKNEITVFPRENNFQLNFDTASRTALLSVALALSGASTNTSPSDAQSLVEKILEYRLGEDGDLLTSDDRDVDLAALNLNDKEKVIALVMNQFKTKKSNYFKVSVKGTDELFHISSRVEAMIERDSLKIVSFKRFY